MIARARALANRSELAKKTNRRLAAGWIQSIVAESRGIADSLRDVDDHALMAHTRQLRQYVRREVDTFDKHLLTLAAGGVIEAIRRVTGMTLFDVQVHAGVVVSCGAVAEMQTGEGKTLSGTLPAYVHALSGRGVHVATTNSYLAQRDHEKLSPVFQRLGLTTGLLTDADDDAESKVAYQTDITYGPGYVFGFDYLKDQLKIKAVESGVIGNAVMRRVNGKSVLSELRQRGLHAVIVDEIDHVLIDDAVSPLLLSSSGQGLAADADLHVLARDLAATFQQDKDFTIQPTGGVELTDQGFQHSYDQTEYAVAENLIRPWHEYVVLALRAKHQFTRDVQYVVADEEIQLVDSSTGRIFEDRTWSDGLHQAVLAAEGLPITPETEPLARITRQRFYRYYDFLGGMTGTATGCENEFARVYGLAVSVVPTRKPSRRKLLPEVIRDTEEQKVNAIGEEVATLHQQGRAVLVGTLNIAQSTLVANELDRRQLPFAVLNGIQDADEAAIVARGGESGAITVATNLAGRGTDIPLDDVVKELGGLHVIVTQRHSLSRVDRQLIGRCARCGDAGTARFYLSAEDDLVTKHAPWVARAIKRRTSHEVSSGDETIGVNAIQRQLARAQLAQQRHSTRARLALLRVDQENEQLVDHSDDPAGCWSL